MVFTILFSLIISARAQDYVKITDPDHQTRVDTLALQPALAANDARFERFPVSTIFSITLWVMIEQFPSGVLNKSIITVSSNTYCWAWLILKASDTEIMFESGGDAERVAIQTQLTITNQWAWRHVTMNVSDQTLKLSIGEYVVGILTQPIYNASNLVAWDSSAINFRLGATSVSNNFNGWILETRFYNSALSVSVISGLISNTQWHATCGTCWGPGESSWLDKTQVTPIYDEVTVNLNNPLVYTFNDNIFERTKIDFTNETTWVGFVKDSFASGLAGIYQHIFATINTYDDAIDPTDTGTANGLYLVSDGTDIDVQFGFSNDSGLGYTTGVLPNKSAKDSYRWVGLSFCNDKVIICAHELDGSSSVPCSTQALISVSEQPKTWGTGTDNVMIIGTDSSADQEHKFKDVRYYFKGCKSQTELEDLFAEQTQLCVSGCQTCSDFQTCDSWQSTGRYKDTTCPLWHRACHACISGNGDTNCQVCTPNDYYFLESTNICHSTCATGYSADDAYGSWSANQSPGLVFELNFDSTAQLQSVSGIAVILGQSTASDGADPVVHASGWFEFDGVDDFLIIGQYPYLTLHVNFSALMWIRIESDLDARNCVLSKQTSENEKFFEMCFEPAGTNPTTQSLAEANIQIGFQLRQVVGGSAQLQSHSEWFLWTITSEYDLGSTSVTSYINLASMASISVNDWIADLDSNTFKLGVGMVTDSDNLVESYFKGYIYNFKLYNTVLIPSELDNSHVKTGADWNSACATACLSTGLCVGASACASNQFEESTMWVNCDSSWTTCTNVCPCDGTQYYRLTDDLTTWVNEWPAGYFADNSQFTWQLCQTTNCSTWSDALTCTQCSGDYYLVPSGAYANCEGACPSNYITNSDKICQACHVTCATWSDTGAQDCASCYSSYLVPEGAWEVACPSNYVSDLQNVCQPCHETCATWDSTGIESCITCIDGWQRSRDDTASSDCLCDINIWENTTSSLKIACMNAPLTEKVYSQDEQLFYVEEITTNPNITTHDLDVVLDVSNEISFEDEMAQDEFNEHLNDAAVRAMNNTGVSSYTYSGTDIEVHLESGLAGSFLQSQTLTESGSGVVIQSLDYEVFRDEPIQINVFQYNASMYNSTNDTLIGKVVSVEVFYLNNGQELQLDNLHENVTIVIDELNLNDTLTYECVYLSSNYTWSTEGCYLSTIFLDAAWCECNHLSQFSIRKFGNAAQVNNNFDSLTDLDNLESFDPENSNAPISCLGAMYALYAFLLIAFWKLDRQSEKIQQAEFVRSRTMRLPNHELVAQISEPVSPKSDQELDNIEDLKSDMINQMVVVDIEQSQIASIYGNKETGLLVPINEDEPIFASTVRAELLSSRSDEENQDKDSLKEEPDGEPTEIINTPDEEKSKKPKFKSMFLEKHRVLGMLFVKHGLISRAEKLTIILVQLMLALFAIGLFYDSDRDPDKQQTEQEKTVEESVKDYGYEDLWITIYAMFIVIPVPLILNKLFERKELNPEDSIEKVEKEKSKMKKKRVLGYIICFAVCAWCTRSTILFSIAFGQNTSQIWLINFAITKFGDFLFKDALIACVSVFAALYLPRIKEVCNEKCRKRKDRYEIDNYGSVENNRRVIIPEDDKNK